MPDQFNPPEGVCRNCGEVFPRSAEWQAWNWCSVACRRRLPRRRQRARKTATKQHRRAALAAAGAQIFIPTRPDMCANVPTPTCIYCGEEFEHGTGVGWKFCSDRCKKRKMRRDHPELKAAQNRRYALKIRTDPERLDRIEAHKARWYRNRPRPLRPRKPPKPRKPTRREAFQAFEEILYPKPARKLVFIIPKPIRIFEGVSLATPTKLPSRLNDPITRMIKDALKLWRTPGLNRNPKQWRKSRQQCPSQEWAHRKLYHRREYDGYTEARRAWRRTPRGTQVRAEGHRRYVERHRDEIRARNKERAATRRIQELARLQLAEELGLISQKDGT